MKYHVYAAVLLLSVPVYSGTLFFLSLTNTKLAQLDRSPPPSIRPPLPARRPRRRRSRRLRTRLGYSPSAPPPRAQEAASGSLCVADRGRAATTASYVVYTKAHGLSGLGRRVARRVVAQHAGSGQGSWRPASPARRPTPAVSTATTPPQSEHENPRPGRLARRRRSPRPARSGEGAAAPSIS